MRRVSRNIAFLACVPSAIVGFAIWVLQRRITKAEKAMQELYSSESDVEAGVAGTPGIGVTFSGISGISSAGDLTGLKVTVIGTDDIKAYKKTN